MQKFFFTFGYAHDHDGYCQPIVARSYEEAERIMFQEYVRQWAFGYTEKEFNESKYTKHLKHLPTIQVKEAI